MRHLLLLGGALAVFFLLARGTAWFGPYTYDEADYMYAASLGPRANWTDIPTMSLREFLRQGLSKTGRAELSDLIRSSGDVVFYRHWHGPLYGDWLEAVSRLTPDERTVRSFNEFFPAAAAIIIYFGLISVLPGSAGTSAAILSVVLYLWGFPVLRSPELAPHHLYALCVAATLLLVMKVPQSGTHARSWWYGAVALSALTFCVLEIAFALVLTLLICAYLERSRLDANWGFAARSAGVFVGTVIMLWPAAILKLSFLKAYLFMAYLALFRTNAWGDQLSLAQAWYLRLINSPVPWLLAAIAVTLSIRRWRKARFLIPPAVFTVISALALFRVNTGLPRYTLPLLPGVILFTAAALGMRMETWRPPVRAGALALIAAAMLLTSWSRVRSRMPIPNTAAEAMLETARLHASDSDQIAVPQSDVPMLHYYFPRVHWRGYVDQAGIREALRTGCQGVIYPGTPPRFVRGVEKP